MLMVSWAWRIVKVAAGPCTTIMMLIPTAAQVPPITAARFPPVNVPRALPVTAAQVPPVIAAQVPLVTAVQFPLAIAAYSDLENDSEMWNMYLDEVKEDDSRITEAWKEDASSIVTFVSHNLLGPRGSSR
jgi:hypothetical protein